MPKKNAVNRKPKKVKKVVKKVAKKKTMKVSVVGQPIPLSFPLVKVSPFQHEKFRTKLAYTENFSMTLSNLAAVQQYFRCNSVYDPNYTGTGTQPYGFDQIAQYYNRYRVISSKIYVIWNPPALVNAARYHFKILRRDEANDGGLDNSDFDTSIECVGSKLATLGHVDETAIRTYSHTSYTYNEKRDIGGKIDTSALVTANPTGAAVQYFMVTAFPANDYAASQGLTYFRVRMVFDVEFTEPVPYAGS